MNILLQVGLLLHIIGLTTIAGTTLVGYITSRQFWIQYKQDKQKGVAIMQAVSKLPVLAGIGLLLLIISGMMMLSATNGFFSQQLWFRIKMIFVLLIIAFSIFWKRRLEKRLRRWVLEDIHENSIRRTGDLVNKIAYVHIFLLSFLLIIFVLSVFRFN